MSSRAVVLLLVSVSCSLAAEFFVSEQGGDCPSDKFCNQLSYYANNSDLYFTDNATFYFLPGVHVLNHRDLFLISNVSNLVLQGTGEMKQGHSDTVWESSSVITCSNGVGGVALHNCSSTVIASLTVSNCGGRITGELMDILQAQGTIWEDAELADVFYGLFILDGTDLTMDRLSVQNCTGYGLTTFNTFNIRVTNSSFSRNNYDASSTTLCKANPVQCVGGNALFFYYDTNTCLPNQAQAYYLDISHTNCSHGVSTVSPTVAGTGLGINVYTSTNYSVVVNIDSVTLHDNVGSLGANLYLVIAASTAVSSITVSNSKIYNGRATIGGAGMSYANFIYNLPPCATFTNGTNVLLVENTQFYGNQANEGAGASIAIHPQTEMINKKVTFSSCSFFDNIGIHGSGLHAIQYNQLTDGSAVDLQILNTTFRNNLVEQFPSDEHPEDVSVIYLIYLHRVTMTDVIISNHSSTGIRLYFSVLTIAGFETIIADNTHDVMDGEGGGIHLGGNSFIILRSPAKLSLINNTAKRGGAIFVEETALTSNIMSPCFFQVYDSDNILDPDNYPIPNVTIYTSGNRATETGDMLYGSSTNCVVVTPSIYLFNRSNNTVFKSVFNYTTNVDNRLVSSDPLTVCFCTPDNLPDCDTKVKNVSAAPGEQFEVLVTMVGLYGGITSGLIQGLVYHNNTVRDIYRLSTEARCTNMTLSVLFNAESANIALDMLNKGNGEVLPSVAVTIQPCPPGFTFSDATKTCDCDETIVTSIQNVSCNVSNMELTRAGDNWIAYDFDDNCTIAYSFCPFAYCNSSSVTFTMHDTDHQCLLNRAGFLCGRCDNGTSLILGSNECRKCSNAYIALLIPFALLGLILVGIVIALNLTVSIGTINGLILYANIIKINETLFFPDGSIPVLSQFIAWLNLDFGIKTCFYAGLDAYSKTWLQFIFPLYIWLIVAAIIVFSPYSKLVSKLVGSNAVPVLSTLILLSYTKVLRTVIQSLLIGYVSCGDSLRRVWQFDANIDYFSPSHMALFIFSLAVVMLIALPYTALVLINPVLEGYLSRFRYFKWLARLKPFYDAYSGPYKDNCRFWPGLLLVARFVLALVIPFGSDTTNLSVILTVVLMLLVTGWNLRGVYNKWYLDLLESWFLLNIAVYCIFGFAGHAAIGGKLSITLVFLTFLGILLYHLNLQLKKTKSGERLNSWCLTKLKNTKVYSRFISDDSTVKSCYVDDDLSSSVTVVRRRESLLSDDIISNRYSFVEI